MDKLADNPKTGAYYMNHPPVVRGRPWIRVALTVALVFALGVALAAATLRSDPHELRNARRQVDQLSDNDLRHGAETVDRQLLSLFDAGDPAQMAAPASTAALSVPMRIESETVAAAEVGAAKSHIHTTAGSPRTKRRGTTTLGPSAASAAIINNSASHDEPDGATRDTVQAAGAGTGIPRELEEMKPGDGVRTLRLTLAQANAWLRMNLSDWARSHDYDLPTQVTRPVVGVDGDQLVMGFRYSGRYYTQSFTVAFTTQFGADGKARLRVESVRAGSLPLPMGAVASTLDGMSLGGSEARHAGQWIERMQDLEFSPTVRLSSGRRLRVVGYRADGDGIELSLRAESKR